MCFRILSEGTKEGGGGDFLSFPLLSACGTNMGNAKFKQLQMGGGNMVPCLTYFSLPGLNLKQSRSIVHRTPCPIYIDRSYCLHGPFIPSLFTYGK